MIGVHCEPKPKTKICPQCKKRKLIVKFGRRSGGKISWCLACSRRSVSTRRKWMLANYPKKWRRYKKHRHLWMKYGISYGSWKELFVAQRGGCAICGQKVKEKNLHIDHCHKTNKIRALLCVNCNTGLGSFKDNLSNLAKAIKYLKKYETKN